jgi:hypothetical protein
MQYSCHCPFTFSSPKGKPVQPLAGHYVCEYRLYYLHAVSVLILAFQSVSFFRMARHSEPSALLPVMNSTLGFAYFSLPLL